MLAALLALGRRDTAGPAASRPPPCLLPAARFDLKIKIVFSLQGYFRSVCAGTRQPRGSGSPAARREPPKPLGFAQSDRKQFANGFGGCFSAGRGGRKGEELASDADSEMIVCRPVIQVADKAPLTLLRARSGSVVGTGKAAAARRLGEKLRTTSGHPAVPTSDGVLGAQPTGIWAGGFGLGGCSSSRCRKQV